MNNLGMILLKRYLKKHNIQQIRFAKRINIHPTQLNLYLNGRRIPSLKTASWLEGLTGIPCESWTVEIDKNHES